VAYSPPSLHAQSDKIVHEFCHSGVWTEGIGGLRGRRRAAQFFARYSWEASARPSGGGAFRRETSAWRWRENLWRAGECANALRSPPPPSREELLTLDAALSPCLNSSAERRRLSIKDKRVQWRGRRGASRTSPGGAAGSATMERTSGGQRRLSRLATAAPFVAFARQMGRHANRTFCR